jgi:hypothetical protein
MGLDLSCTGTGIVVVDEAGAVQATARDGWELHRDSTVLDKIDRLLHIAKTILDLATTHRLAGDGLLVGIEGYAYNQRGATADLGELGGVVKTQLWLSQEIAPRILAVTTARALVFANGRLKKKLVQPMLVERGLTFGDPDIADAYVIAEALRLQARREINGDGSEGKGRPRRARKNRGGDRHRARRDPAPGAGAA